MGNDSLRVTTLFPGVRPSGVYRAWLGAESHAAMTGGTATAQQVIGVTFTAWDGYITGQTLELERDTRILQSWRTTEFPDEAPDSLVEITIEDEAGGTRVTLVHTVVPADQVAAYADGWEKHYFIPMRAYFAARAAERPAPPAKKKAAPPKKKKPAPPAKKKKPAPPAKKKAAPPKKKKPAPPAKKKKPAPKKKKRGKR